MARAKRNPRKSHKIVPEFRESEFYEACACSTCQVRIRQLDRPWVLADWVTTPGWGEWNPKTKTYSERQKPPQKPVPIERKAVQTSLSPARLAALEKARAARLSKLRSKS